MMQSLSSKYLLGIRSISTFFGLSFTDTTTLLQRGGIPGAFKLKRKAEGGFNGGGRGIWALNIKLAEQYRHTRNKTPAYDPRRAVEALVNKFEGTGLRTIPELIEHGYIDDLDWCRELDRQREISNLHVPILMHRDDLKEWLGTGLDKVTRDMLYPSTAEIFKPIRNRG